MSRLVSEKMGITKSERVLVINGPAEAVEAINLPLAPFTDESSGVFDHVIFFSRNKNELDEKFPHYKKLMAKADKLWIAWPKKGQLGTDLNIKEVIRIGYNHGLVESTNLRIDDTWTALKFTYPKADKTYRNSYGRLPTQALPVRD